MNLLTVLAGASLAVVGFLILTRALQRLQRNRAFGANFWASLPQFFSYRLKTLRPVGPALLGLALLVGGLVVLYLGIVGFYTARLGQPSTH